MLLKLKYLIEPNEVFHHHAFQDTIMGFNIKLMIQNSGPFTTASPKDSSFARTAVGSVTA